ncbi:hypothetical protein JAAARDRAFT_121248 [Jaapia argillacea MUCL 33604]|uniref:SH3 domain-containing protein n=1 Tax=Jaapia argillacea MUCL 33604 TaxID=933084 RepID=A0A067QJD7_9AGAM|nr:hypothetical protein JAAARDRAFT_121248 [Jaapia argillacea MUCL 33604]
MSVRPFSPSEAFGFPLPPGSDWGSAKPPPRSGRASVQSMWTAENETYETAPSSTPENPFEDPESDRGSNKTSIKGFEELEIISRPFAPTLTDELPVAKGEHVHVLKVYDDGWAMVEKIDQEPPSEKPLPRGLIPVDCFRALGEELPAFLATKRVSSYGAFRL